jgi:dihydroorotate dehydrogenase
MTYSAIRPLLFRLDPESAHDLAVKNIQRVQQIGIVLRAIARWCCPPAAARRDVLGLSFPSPIGIAAGFDKNAVMIPFLAALGFGFIEVGTVTLQPQPGNPRPRMFRYPDAKALINRMGFNNDGAAAVAERLQRYRSSVAAGFSPPMSSPPIFVNIGKNRDVPLDAAPAAYAACYARLAPHADAVVLNLSSPNTPSLRELQRPEHLTAIIAAVRSAGPRRPLLVKIAPDIDDVMLGEVCNVTRTNVDGMICTNTTIDRLPGMNEAGGLSGRPLMEKSTNVLARVRQRVGPDFPLIGVGGVFTIDDVRAKLAAGADLVQLYTGFIYEGPLVAARLARELAASEAHA